MNFTKDRIGLRRNVFSYFFPHRFGIVILSFSGFALSVPFGLTASLDPGAVIMDVAAGVMAGEVAGRGADEAAEPAGEAAEIPSAKAPQLLNSKAPRQSREIENDPVFFKEFLLLCSQIFNSAETGRMKNASPYSGVSRLSTAQKAPHRTQACL